MLPLMCASAASTTLPKHSDSDSEHSSDEEKSQNNDVSQRVKPMARIGDKVKWIRSDATDVRRREQALSDCLRCVLPAHPSDLLNTLQHEAQVELERVHTQTSALARKRSLQGQASSLPAMIRSSFAKAGAPIHNGVNSVTRRMLGNLSIPKLQVILEDFHSHVQNLNEMLMSLLMERDELFMSQDSLLVDIQDLTQHLLARQGAPISDVSSQDPIKN